MNYDGPSFYKKDQSKIKTIDQDENKKSDVSKESTNYQKTPLNNSKIESRSEDHYFRNKHILKSSENLDSLRKAKRNKELIAELEERLSKEKEDYLLFSEYLSEDSVVEKIEENSKEKLAQKPANKKIGIKKETNTEKINEKEKASLVPKEIKADLTKPNTGLHRTLSKIIAEDQEVLKNGKNQLDSLFSEKEKE